MKERGIEIIVVGHIGSGVSNLITATIGYNDVIVVTPEKAKEEGFLSSHISKPMLITNHRPQFVEEITLKDILKNEKKNFITGKKLPPKKKRR